MYTIEMKPYLDGDLVRVSNGNGDYFQVLPHKGASIHELSIKGTKVISGRREEEYLQNLFAFEGSKLTPFPGRIKEGKYNFDGKQHFLEKNDALGLHAIHGLMYSEEFEVIDKIEGEDRGVVVVRNRFGGSKGYPFPFNIEIEFEFSQNGLKVSTHLENTGNQSFPIGDGWHPYFELGPLDECVLTLPDSSRHILSSDIIPTGVKEDFVLKNKNLRSIELDDVFQLKNSGIEVTTLSRNGKVLSIWQNASFGYKYIVVYTPGTRDRIAIEPLTCPPDSFNNKMDLIILNPGDKLNLEFGIQLDMVG